MDFAKIFNLSDGSLLLITKEFDEKGGDEKWQLVFRIGIADHGFTTSITIGYISFEIRDGVYDEFTPLMAQDLYDNIPRNKDLK